MTACVRRSTLSIVTPSGCAAETGGTLPLVARRRDIGRLQEEIEELFSDLWQVPRFAGTRVGFRPAVDCYRTEDPPALTVVVELAGIDPESVDITVVERTLVVAGVRPRPAAAPGAVYQQVEIEFGPFERRLALGVDVDSKGAEATYADGLLKIVLPLARRAAGPIKVPVEVRREP
jgi:HSP20 family protein